MALGSWLILHWEPNQLAASGYTRTSIKPMAPLTSINLGLWKKVLHRRKGSIMRRLLPPQQNGLPSGHSFALRAQNGWKVHQMDVKTTFLNGDLKENVFMSQREGFAVKGHEDNI